MATLTWPPPSTTLVEAGAGGFGGTVPLETSTYQKLGVAKEEIRQIEKAEAPLKPEEEKAQRERELPPPELLRPSAADKSEEEIPPPAAVSIAEAVLAEKGGAGPTQKKKRKKTLF